MLNKLFPSFLVITMAIVAYFSPPAAARPVANGSGRIMVKARAYVSTSYLSAKERQRIRKSGRLRGQGSATYAFQIPATGWYELYVHAGTWPVQLYLDHHFLIHTPFKSGVWPNRDHSYKVTNLYLHAGRHTLRFSRLSFPGLPYMMFFFLQPARDITGKVHLSLKTDHLVFRENEKFPVHLRAGESDRPAYLLLEVVGTDSGRVRVPAGQGVFQRDLTIPTDQQGVFDLHAVDGRGEAVARVIQFAVVDTRHRAKTPARLTKKLIATIDCAKVKPAFAAPGTRVIHSSLGAYIESGAKGRWGNAEQASFFAYRLTLPQIQKPYLIEVDYPDNDERTFTIMTFESQRINYSLDGGVVCGGPYPLSNKIQTFRTLIYPRQKHPLVIFLNFKNGQRAAAKTIRVYRITSGLPALKASAGRKFGMYWEETLRFPQYFGAMPSDNGWENILGPYERAGRWSRYIGVNPLGSDGGDLPLDAMAEQIPGGLSQRR